MFRHFGYIQLTIQGWAQGLSPPPPFLQPTCKGKGNISSKRRKIARFTHQIVKNFPSSPFSNFLDPPLQYNIFTSKVFGYKQLHVYISRRVS